jgi:hypothetical protein
MSVQPVVTSDPGMLVATLPGALGHEPSYSTVFVGINDEQAPNAATVVEVDHDEPLALRIARAVEQIAADGAREVVIVTYDGRYFGDQPGSAFESIGAYAATCCTDEGLNVRDCITVADRPEGRRWRSYNCTTPDCCPPEGSAIPTPTEGDTHA